MRTIKLHNKSNGGKFTIGKVKLFALVISLAFLLFALERSANFERTGVTPTDAKNSRRLYVKNDFVHEAFDRSVAHQHQQNYRNGDELTATRTGSSKTQGRQEGQLPPVLLRRQHFPAAEGNKQAPVAAVDLSNSTSVPPTTTEEQTKRPIETAATNKADLLKPQPVAQGLFSAKNPASVIAVVKPAPPDIDQPIRYQLPEDDSSPPPQQLSSTNSNEIKNISNGQQQLAATDAAPSATSPIIPRRVLLQQCKLDQRLRHSLAPIFLSTEVSPVNVYGIVDRVAVRTVEETYPATTVGKIACYWDGDIICSSFHKGLAWEPALYSSLNRVFRRLRRSQKYPVLIDVGANVGSIAFRMASKGYDVHLIEAMPSNVYLLRLSRCLNAVENPHGGISQRTFVYATAVGEQEGECDLWSEANNLGDGQLRCPSSSSSPEKPLLTSSSGPTKSSAAPQQQHHRGKVPVRTLDSIVLQMHQTYYANAAGEGEQKKKEEQPFPTPTYVVKIDIEGFEYNAMKGFRTVLRNSTLRPLVIFSEVAQHAMVGGALEFLQSMAEWYSIFSLDLDIWIYQQPATADTHQSSHGEVGHQQHGSSASPTNNTANSNSSDDGVSVNQRVQIRAKLQSLPFGLPRISTVVFVDKEYESLFNPAPVSVSSGGKYRLSKIVPHLTPKRGRPV